MSRLTQLENALRDLLHQVDSLDDYSLTRDLEEYKAQVCWDDAIFRAHKVLEECDADKAVRVPSIVAAMRPAS